MGRDTRNGIPTRDAVTAGGIGSSEGPVLKARGGATLAGGESCTLTARSLFPTTLPARRYACAPR
jgi:hypothetical protein